VARLRSKVGMMEVDVAAMRLKSVRIGSIVGLGLMSTDARSAWLAPYPSLVHQGVYINGDKRAAHATHKPVTVTYVSLVAIIRFSV